MEFYKIEETNRLRQVMSWIVDIAAVISLAWFVVYGFCGQVRISGQSMMPGLSAEDVVLVNRLAYDVGEPDRLDVVVFEREDKKANVKRIIGLPGETVQVADGLIYIDGKVLEAPEKLRHVSLAGLAENPIQLEADEYFLLGDNRDSSEDSRFANIGNVKRKQIQGKVWFRLMPFSEIGWIE